MTERFVSRSKLGKKARKQAAAAARRTWSCSPVSRVKESRKVYNRSRIDSRGRSEDAGDGFFIFGNSCYP